MSSQTGGTGGSFGGLSSGLPGGRALRRVSGSMLTLRDEADDLIDDFRADVKSYRGELSVLESTEAVAAARADLDHIERDLKIAAARLSNGRYVSAYGIYYRARRDLIDVVPALVAVDRKRGRNRNRLRELADQLRAQASELGNAASTAEIRTLLDGVDFEPVASDPTRIDTSGLKMAARRIDELRLARLKYLLQLRRAFGTLNVLLTVVVVTLAVLPVLPFVLIGPLDGLVDLSDSPVYRRFPLVLFFGFVGAAVNIVRRIGGGFGFFETAQALELPNDLVMRRLMWSRLLFGGLGGLLVYVFATTSIDPTADGLTTPFVIVTAFFAGFSEQFFDRALEKRGADLFGEGNRRERAGTEASPARPRTAAGQQPAPDSGGVTSDLSRPRHGDAGGHGDGDGDASDSESGGPDPDRTA